MASTPLAACLLAALVIVIDVLGIVLPSVAGQLWARRRGVYAVLAWLLWPVFLSMNFIAVSGFVSTELAGALAGRAKSEDIAIGARDRLHRLRTEQAQIFDTRSVAAIDAEIAREQAANWVIWRMTRGCRVVTRAESAQACDRILVLRRDRANALRRDELDQELRQAEAEALNAPRAAAADPGAVFLAGLLDGFGFKVTEEQIQRARIVMLGLTLACAGLMLAFVAELTHRQHAAVSARS
jgi:hypothetical protein